MLELIPMKAPHVIGIRVDGKIEKDDILRVIEAGKSIMAKHDSIHIYVEAVSFDGISFEALWEDMSFAFPNLKHFTRKAVVSDTQWMEIFSKIGDKLFPGIEVRHFSPAEKDAAIQWIEER